MTDLLYMYLLLFICAALTSFLFVLRVYYKAGEPRTEKMLENQDWTSVYPASATFRPTSVPLPVRMGYPVKGGVPPEKKGNLELIKVRMTINI